jgi:hypothetical protein
MGLAAQVKHKEGLPWCLQKMKKEKGGFIEHKILVKRLLQIWLTP